MNRIIATAGLALLAAGCSTAREAAREVDGVAREVASEVAGAPRASARLMNAQGATVGTATLEQHANGVEIDVHVTGLPAGTHGIHIHEVGTCTPPDFTSAGGHFNPTQRNHGLESPQGPHGGDLPNLQIANGMGHAEMMNPRVTLREGATSLFDANGSAIVIHATADDQRTDPSGNSGARIACGVVVRG